jgi:signal transduction histidine kinase
MTLAQAQRLLTAAQALAALEDLPAITGAVLAAARDLVGCDGATFVLREGDQVVYADENALGPLWKGQRFASSACISGWSIEHRESVAIEDIYADHRIPQDAYRPTFVKSLAMIPIRPQDPLGALGAYWATRRLPTLEEVALLEVLAELAGAALANVERLREVRAALGRAQAAIEQRDELLSVASHELKTPLTSLTLAIEGLSRDARRANIPVGDKGMDRVVRAEKQVHRLTALVNQLLDFSRISLGRMTIQPSDFDLAVLADDVATRFRDLAVARTGQPLDVRGLLRLHGRWDKDRLDQVLTNLISNALKYGGGKPIWLSVERVPPVARVRVHDDGIGIDPADQQRIFERFERPGGTHAAGVGLGLWISRELVQAHGGQITVESRPGQGATFTVELPLSVD